MATMIAAILLGVSWVSTLRYHVCDVHLFVDHQALVQLAAFTGFLDQQCSMVEDLGEQVLTLLLPMLLITIQTVYVLQDLLPCRI